MTTLDPISRLERLERLKQLEAVIERNRPFRKIRIGTKRTDLAPTTVYIVRAANGRTLYVGVSLGVLNRFGAHKHGAWWQQAKYIELQHFQSRSAALNRETELIASLRPVHNIAKGTIK